MSLTTLEQLVRSGDYPAAMRVFLDLVRESSLSGRDLAFAYHCASVAEYQMRNYMAAQRLAQQAEHHAQHANDHGLLGRIWINLIPLCMDIGDAAESERYGQMWLANQANYPELAQQLPRVYYNLGRTCRFRKETAAMFNYFRAAIALEQGSSLPPGFWVQVYQSHAWGLYKAELFREGDQAAEKATALVEPDDLQGLKEAQLLRAFRAYQIGDGTTALRIAEEFVAQSEGSTERQLFWALWITSMVASDRSMFEHAMTVAAMAQGVATRLLSAEYMNLANEARIRARHLQELHKG